jgi:L-threonylcarbamoyladenylate synthase
VRTIDARKVPVGEVVEQAAAVVRDGGVIIFPTDTVYGIGCDPTCHPAIDRIYALKDRARQKPLVLHFAHPSDLLPYILDDERAVALARRFLPGPLTLVVSRPAAIDPYLTGDLPTLGLRVPEHPLSQAMLERFGPLAATSANPSGAQPYTGRESFADLPEADLLVDAGAAPHGIASTVVDISQREIRLIREGTLPFAAILESLSAAGQPRRSGENHSI